MAHQTSHYAGWLLLLNIGWLSRPNLAKEAPVAHYGCQRWQVREASGRSIATSSASPHSIEPLDLASSICNFKAPESELERCGHVYMFVRCVFVCVAHYSFVSPWVSRGHSVPLCAGRVRRREAHLDMRSQIMYLTLHQEGSTERRRAKLKERKGEKQTREWTPYCRRKPIGQKRKQWRESVCLRERTWEIEQKRQGGRDGGWMLLCFLIRVAERFYCPQPYSVQCFDDDPSKSLKWYGLHWG